jgi:dGTPase
VYDYADPDRVRRVPEPPKRAGSGEGGRRRSEFARDRARVLHSYAFRRLADKTQVVVPGADDFPRTRLTHSLEVAQIGREIGAALGCDPDLVDAAGLAHDIGHPPFGHNGEDALDEVAAACGGFEANAQTLRVLTRLEARAVGPAGEPAGLNLTRAALDAVCKYPWPRRADTGKFGVYEADLAAFSWLRSAVPEGRRCLEAQVMDWADDVAYSVHDLEDGVQAGHVPLDRIGSATEGIELVALARESYLEVPTDELAAALDRLREQDFWLGSFDGSMRAMVALKRMTSELIGRLCGAATRATREQAGGEPLRRYAGNVVVPAQTRAECAVLKAMADRYVMRREVTVRMQTRQREQLTELLEAVETSAPSSLEPWLRTAYEAAPDDDARLRVVVDQVASLTDTSAMAWHDRLVT